MRKRRSSISKKAIMAFMLIGMGCVFAVSMFVSPVLRSYVDESYTGAKTWVRHTGNTIAKKSGFSVENIHISGLKYTSKLDILKVLNINYGDNIFTIDTEALLSLLKQIGWIEHITIHKKFPNTVEIIIQEYKPYALWQYKGKVVVIAETGVVIPNADPRNFTDLMLVVGERANLQCKSLFSILTDYPGFKDMISSAQYMYGRRWRLYFSTGVLVDLPESNIGDSIHRVYTLHQKQKILDRDVEIVDMRIQNKLVFKGMRIAKKQKN